MHLKQADYRDHVGKAVARIGRCALSVPMMALLACAGATVKSVEAASVDIFLIAEQTAPSSSTGSPFSVTTSTVYQLGGLNSNSRATTAALVDNFTFNVGTALTYNSHENPDPAQPSDPGEAGAGTASYVNFEMSTWDNAGIAGSTIDASEQIDFGRNASVTFNSVVGGFTDLIIADLGGLNPFDLSLCSDASCSVVETVFAGFSRSLTTFLTGLNVFAASDTGVASEMDQTWLFRFSDPIFDFVRVLEFDNRKVFTGARLQADFIGIGTPSSTTPVPGPAGLPLLASGLGLLAWALRRRKRV